VKLSRFKIYTKQASMMLQDTLIYRADMMTRILSSIVRFLIAAFLWLAVLQSSNGEVAGYNVQEILTYFLLMQVITGFIFSGAMSGFRMAQHIQSGDLSTRIIQPADFIKLTYSIDIGRGFFFFLLNVLIVGIIGFLFQDFFVFNFSPLLLAAGFIGILLAFTLNFCFVILIGMLAFWITSSTRLIFTFFAILQLLSGMLVPLEFFPERMQSILYMTPFPYICYGPVKILQSTQWGPEITSLLLNSAGFCVMMLSFVYLVYYLGLRKYEAVGR
jgi:ABC-2 type transport system permease protein